MTTRIWPADESRQTEFKTIDFLSIAPNERSAFEMIDGRIVSLRPIEDGDLAFLTELANHPGVRSMVVGWDWPISLRGQRNWIDSVVNNQRSMRLTVLDKESRSPIGLTGLWEVDWRNGSALTAIKLMPGASPKGAGSDAIMLVNAWAFYEVGLRRLHSTILDYNGPSMGAYVGHCGWKIEGRERESVFRGGEWCDLYHVALLRSDFDDHNAASEYINYVCNIDVKAKAALALAPEAWRDHIGHLPTPIP